VFIDLKSGEGWEIVSGRAVYNETRLSRWLQGYCDHTGKVALYTADVARGEVKFFHTLEDLQASFIFPDRANKEDGVPEALGVRRKIEGSPP
jgi:hypothetical protein